MILYLVKKHCNSNYIQWKSALTKLYHLLLFNYFEEIRNKVLVSDCNPTHLIGQCQPQKIIYVCKLVESILKVDSSKDSIPFALLEVLEFLCRSDICNPCWLHRGVCGIAKSTSDHVPLYKDPMKIQSKGVKSSLTIAASSSISLFGCKSIIYSGRFSNRLIPWSLYIRMIGKYFWSMCDKTM